MLGAIAGVLLAYGFFVHGIAVGQRLLALVGGFLLLFVALAAVFSRLVRPVVAVLGIPFASLGRSSGALAAFNVRRNPGRTASTAAALMIGITLVSFISLFGRALRGADTDAWRSQVTADYVVTSQNGWDAFSSVAADRASAVPGVELVSHVRGDRGRVGSANAGISGVDPSTVGRALDVQVTATWTYIRFHGGAHGTGFEDDELQPWAERIRAWRAQGIDSYSYFNNDTLWNGRPAAIDNARRLIELVGS